MVILIDNYERVKMYAYLKDNSFYIRMENDGLFLKNNYSDINVVTPKSYTLFLTFIKYLDGKNDVEALIENIGNESIKRFYKELLKVLKEQRFVLYDDKAIDISKYSDDDKQLLYYFGDLKEWKQYNSNMVYIEVEGPDKSLIEVFTSLFGKRIHVKGQVADKEYIRITLHMENEIENIYIYKEIGTQMLMISTKKPEMELDGCLADLPFHVYEIIGGLLGIEIWLMVHNAPVDNFFDKDYMFDLKILNGRHIERKNKDAS